MINVLVSGTNIKRCMVFMDTLIDAHVYRLHKDPRWTDLSPTLILVWKTGKNPVFLNSDVMFLAQYEYSAEMVRAAVWGAATLNRRFPNLDAEHVLNNLEELDDLGQGGLYVVAHTDVVRSDWKVNYKTEADA